MENVYSATLSPVRIFIMGAGRSGTSLAAGLFRYNDLFMGDNLLKPSQSNPYGYFEDHEINSINEALIEPRIHTHRVDGANAYCQDIPNESQRWLARVPTAGEIGSNDSIDQRIRSLYARGSSCFKDPRFCYTIHLWRRLLPREEAASARFLCIFRHPSIVVQSILKEMHTAQYLRDLAISINQLYSYWHLVYQHILDKHSLEGRWLFLSYESLFTENGHDQIEQFCKLAIDRSFPRKDLNRSEPLDHVSPQCLEIYEELLLLERNRI